MKHNAPTAIDSASRTKVDELNALQTRIDSLNQRITDSYLMLLEKTNGQLSLWYNPYGVMIASLGVLFTLLTIVAAGIIYRQSKDYRDRLNAFIRGYKKIFDEQIADLTTRREAIDTQIKNNEAKLADATAEQKLIFQVELDKLKSERASISSQLASTFATNSATGSVLGTLSERYQQCSHCGYRFKSTAPITSFFLQGKPTVNCPNCGKPTEILLWGHN